MTLYLARHGRAEPGHNKPDEERRLTPEGVAELEVSAGALVRLQIRPARVLTSPLVRARQTAEILHHAAAPSAPLIEVAGLASGAAPTALRAAIVPHARSGGVLLAVGHMPDLAQLVALLTDRAASFEPGGLARLELDDTLTEHAGTLTWLLSPARLAQIAAGAELP